MKATEAGDNMVISQKCFVSRLNLDCFSEPDKKITFFKGWYISNVQETAFSKLNQRVDT